MISPASPALVHPAVPDRPATLEDERVWHELRRMINSVLDRGELVDRNAGRTGQASITVEFTAGEAAYLARIDAVAGAGRPGGVLVVAVEQRGPQLPSIPELRRRFGLTPREAQVALLLAQRRSNTEIARDLFVSEYTARRHTEQVIRKLRVAKRTEVRRVLLGGRLDHLPQRVACREDRHGNGGAGTKPRAATPARARMAATRGRDACPGCSEPERRPLVMTMRRSRSPSRAGWKDGPATLGRRSPGARPESADETGFRATTALSLAPCGLP